MRHTNINLMDSHLAERNLNWVAQDLIALDNADRVCELLGLNGQYIQEGRDLFNRFARELDPEFAQQAQELAETWKNEDNAPAYIYTEAPRNAIYLRFPERPVTEAPSAPARPKVTELAVRSYVVEVEGRVVAVLQKNREFKYCYVQRQPMVDGFETFNFSATEKNCRRGARARWAYLKEGGRVVELREVFTVAELEEAQRAERAEVQRTRKIQRELAKRYPELLHEDAWGRKSLRCDLPADEKLSRARKIWDEIR